MGKPADGADMKLGLITSPTYFAIKKFPELKEIIKRKCSQDGDLEIVIMMWCLLTNKIGNGNGTKE